LPGQAAELVDRRVALIIAAGGTDPARAAKGATSTIPIVFVSAADPVRTGIVTSLSRPEGNVTGINMVGATLEAKRLELLHEVVPQASIIGVLINPKYPAAKIQTQEVQEATARLGVQLVLRNASTEGEVDAAFAAFVAQKAGAVLACNDPFFGSYREQLAALALRHKLPAMSFRREFAEVGGLLSYGAVFEEGYRQAGVYAARILKGAKTTDLPVMQPTKFELVVNLKTAKALGLAISESFLLRADAIIE
jgi:putative tryptophan/tyrosine transport system substrate-binding protein